MTTTDHTSLNVVQASTKPDQARMVGLRPHLWESDYIGCVPEGHPDTRMASKYPGRCAGCGYGFKYGRQIAYLAEPVMEWHTKAQEHVPMRTMDWECYLKRLRNGRHSVCEYCGANPTRLEVDHIVPRAHGGDDEPENMASACRWCNATKSDMPAEDYVEWLAASMCGWAIRYAEAGFHVFPLKAGGKEPITRNGFKDATTNITTIRKWWYEHTDANIGIATGASGLCVIDIDTINGAGWWAKMENTHGHLNTLMVDTGRGGLHLIYAGTGMPNTAGKLADGIDTRGDGGYIVAPPSLHPNGNRYQWNPRSNGVMWLPDWVASELDRKPFKTVGIPRAAAGNTPYGMAAVKKQVAAVMCTGNGGRNHALNIAAFALGQLVAGGELLEDYVIDALTYAGQEIGLTPREITKTIKSGMDSGAMEPRNAPVRAAA